MNKRNGHQPLAYRGPAKPIKVGVTRNPIDLVEIAVYAIGVCVVLLDVFYWRS